MQSARGHVVKKVFQPANIVTSSRTVCRKCFQIRQGCNLLEDSSSKSFSNKLRLQPARGFVVEKVFELARLTSSSRTRSRKNFPSSQCCNRSMTCCRKGFQTSQGCNLLQDSLSKRFSNQLKLWQARALVVEKVFQSAKVQTSSRTLRGKGFLTKQGCNRLEDSMSKRISNQPNLEPARGLVVERFPSQPMLQPARGLVVEKVFKPATFAIQCIQLEVTSSSRFSNQLTLQQARRLVKNVFQPPKVATCSRTRRRKGFPKS